MRTVWTWMLAAAMIGAFGAGAYAADSGTGDGKRPAAHAKSGAKAHKRHARHHGKRHPKRGHGRKPANARHGKHRPANRKS